ncbi:MAG TPA: hypothetical protein VI792_08020 [Candidatus Eisenbacteria bacterium]
MRTSSVLDQPLRKRLARHYDRLRAALVTRYALRAASVACLAAVAGLALGLALPVQPATAWARAAGALALALAAVIAALVAMRRELPGFDRYLERVEQRFPDVRSWLRNALDLESRPAPHTSAELAHALARETARRLEGTPLETLRPRIEPKVPLLLIAVAGIAVAVLAVLAPGRIARSWETMWNPAAAAPEVRLVVEPGSVRLTPGAALAVRAQVWGSRQRPRLLLGAGAGSGEAAPEASAEGGGPGGARTWRFDLTQLTHELSYRVRVAGVQSPIYRIALAGEPQAVSFQIEYRAPAYARLPVQRGAATRGDLSALRGSRARIEALFDRDLESVEARVGGGSAVRWSAVTPRRWRGEIALDRDGEYDLGARAAGNPPGEGTFRYRIRPLPDAPPILIVRRPQGDVDLPAGQQVPLEVLAQDDLGLSDLRLQVRRDADQEWTTLPLAHFADHPREAQLAKDWDASPLGLLPGQSASFRLELLDDNAIGGPGRALSPVFELRFPSLAELYQRIDDRQGDAQKSLEKLGEQSRELQKSLDKLSRDVRPPSAQAPAFERSEEMKSTLQRQQQLSETIEQTAQQLRESLEMAAERQVFDDRLTRKLEEIASLVDQIQSKDFKDALQKMREALEKMDRRETERSLPQLRQENQELMANLERTAELLKQLRQEEKLAALAQRAQEQKTAQDLLNRGLDEPSMRDSSLARAQEQAAQETEQLAKDAQDLAKETERQGEQQQLDDAAKTLQNEAAPQQREASQSSSRDPQRASKAGRQASESLARAAQTLQQMLDQRQQEQQDIDLAAVRRAAQDLVSIQREADRNIESGDPPSERANRQSDLSEGVARVADSLHTLAKHTPFIKPQLSEALGQAMSSLAGSAKMLDQGNRPGGEQAGRGARAALNQAVLELRASESGMCDKPGGGMGSKQSPGSRMSQISAQQGKLNEHSKRLTQQMSEQMRMSAGDQDEMRRLADEQHRIREQLGQLQQDQEASRKLLGRLDDTQREMKEVEEALREGSTEGEHVEQMQQHILSRLLDAQRSLNRQDYDPQRESRPGEDIARRSPAELSPDLLRETDRLRLDLLKAEADRYPAQYRAFIEAYLRSLDGSPR